MTEKELENLVSQSVAKGVQEALSRAKQIETESDLLSKTQSAAKLGISISSFSGLVRAGYIEKQRVGKILRFLRSDIEALAKKPLPSRPRPKK